MPFQSDAAWPPPLLTIFQIARNAHGSFENRYYGPYNKLLTYCFGDGFDFVVTPQAPPTENSRDTVDFIVYLIVFSVDKQKPVFLIEVKDDAHRLFPTKRKAADEQMRLRYDDLIHECPLPFLYGLSVLALRCVRVLEPSLVEIDRRYLLPEDYLQDQWDVDILSPQGFQEMKRIISFIREAVVS
ncbi:hypothetical protein R3P38DRAFT_3128456 [Favolaschia claudopus]|uniref:Type I restriction enzyme R protein N-terminal domain-containing protein n=1 Tax=Favolaschia claudopus TaxID=2862362 RepID=A0AAV9Z9A2_9AGAR